MASREFFQCKFISSLTLSKTSILASIAIPTESINQATEARVSTIQKSFTIDRVIIIYKTNAIEAINQEIL